WGDPARATALPRAVRALLPLLLGRMHRPTAAPAISAVEVPPTRLADADLTAFGTLVGRTQLCVDDDTRLRRAAGRSTPDLLRRRDLQQRAPDAVIRPADHEEVAAVL